MLNETEMKKVRALRATKLVAEVEGERIDVRELVDRLVVELAAERATRLSVERDLRVELQRH